MVMIDRATPCPTCGAPTTHRVTPHDRTRTVSAEVRWCASCERGFTEPPPSGTSAAPTTLPGSGPMRRVADRVLAGELTPFRHAVPRGGRVLDIGGGAGNRARVLARMGYDVTVVEPDPAQAAQARTQLAGLATVCGMGIEDLPADMTPFDAALLSHVLEHLSDPDDVLLDVRRRLRPGGTLVVMVPNAGGVEARAFRGRWHAWEPARHRWHFTRDGLRRIITQAGFVEVDVRVAGGWRYPSSIAFSIAPRLDPQTFAGMRHIGAAVPLVLSPIARLLVAMGHGGQLVAVARAPD